MKLHFLCLLFTNTNGSVLSIGFKNFYHRLSPLHVGSTPTSDNPIQSIALQAQYLPHNGELSALIEQNHFHIKVEGRSRSVIQDCGCDREGRKTKLVS